MNRDIIKHCYSIGTFLMPDYSSCGLISDLVVAIVLGIPRTKSMGKILEKIIWEGSEALAQVANINYYTSNPLA